MLLGQQAAPPAGRTPWRYGQFGPGGGSVPYNVMATGAIAPFNPIDVRHDIAAQFVQRTTQIPVGQQPGVIPGAGMPAPAATNGVLLGASQDGRPVREFRVSGNPNAIEAKAIAAGARQVAQIMRQQGLFNLPSDLVGGPLSSLARGEVAVLKWPNGVSVGAAL